MPKGIFNNSIERANKISQKLKGRKLSEITKKKIGNNNYMKGKFGKDCPMFGKRWKIEDTSNYKGQNGFKKGDKNINWNDGSSFELYGIDWTDDLKDGIRKRDKYICQECGIHQDELRGFHKRLDIHHIDYNKKNLNPKNLITLCRSCHIKTNYNREYWINYF